MRTLRFAFAFALLLLCGCDNRTTAQKLEDQEVMMQRAGASDDELCAQGRKIAQAYLESGDEDNYRIQKLIARQTCANAELNRRLGGSDEEPQDMNAVL